MPAKIIPIMFSGYCQYFVKIIMAGMLCMLHAAAVGAGVINQFYVATDGDDTLGDGSITLPWRTITFALDSVPDNSVILVRPGLYQGRIRIRGVFSQGVSVQSEQPYQARLRHNDTVITVFDNAQNISIQGFDIAHDGPGAGGLVVQIQDLGGVGNIVMQNNIMHDSFNNDILKINNGVSNVIVRGNLFYNQQGSDEHIDINSVSDVLVEDNIFFNDFAASGRTNNNDTSSYIVIKDSNADDDVFIGSRNVSVRRNIFLNWQGNNGANFVLCGEDGQPFHEAFDILVENNLILGNSNNSIRAPFGVKGCRDVTFRANTIIGDMPGNAFAMRLNREGANLPLENISFYNNIWSDPSGSMQDFSDSPVADTLSFTLENNQYWNGGQALPDSGNDLINPSDDIAAIIGLPGLPAQASVATPFWVAGQNEFNGGYASIREAFIALSRNYGFPSVDSMGIDQALAAQMPADDLLGQSRDDSPDLGALEQLVESFFSDGFEK